MESLQEIRKMFPAAQNKVFLNHAAMSPLPIPAIRAMQKFMKEFSQTATVRREDFDEHSRDRKDSHPKQQEGGNKCDELRLDQLCPPVSVP